MGNSKIVYYGKTLIDLTGDTVEAAKLLKGVTAHDKKGEKITGTLSDVTQATPAITVDAAGKITASATQAAGVVAAGTKSATKQLPVQAVKTVTPSASAQTAVAKGVFTTGIITVAAVYAVISVTYPSGSTCTCTNGSKTLRAKDTSGKALFVIPSAGTWTVKAVKGSQSASKAVSITAEGQVATVTLMYVFYMFKENEGIGSGLSLKGVNYFTSGAITNSDLPYSPSTGFSVTKECISANQKNTGNSYWISEKIDVSNYKTLKLDLVCSDRYDDTYSISFGVGPDVPPSQSSIGTYTASKTGIYNTKRGVQSVDISNVNGEVYLKIKGYAVVHKIYNWWLE